MSEETRYRGTDPTGGACARSLDLLPLHLQGRVSDPGVVLWLQAHLSACGDCQEEEVFLRGILPACPQPPGDLVASVMSRLASPATSPRPEVDTSSPSVAPLVVSRPWLRRIRPGSWAASVAALLVIGLGIGTLWNGDTAPGGDLLFSAFLEDDDGPRGADEWMVAGAPVLDALSDEVLFALVSEVGR